MAKIAPDITLTGNQVAGILRYAEKSQSIQASDLATDLKTTLANVRNRLKTNRLGHYFTDIAKALRWLNAYKPSLITGGSLTAIYTEFNGNFKNGHF